MIGLKFTYLYLERGSPAQNCSGVWTRFPLWDPSFPPLEQGLILHSTHMSHHRDMPVLP